RTAPNEPYPLSLHAALPISALDEAKANLAYAKAALVEAEANYQIGMNVRKANPAAISEQELNQRLGARDEAAASVQQAEASIERDRKSTRLNSSHVKISYAV